jgi:2-polyprenyl-3-methyl-5-hydroxy-6-metoxy-1,4-benzoquinol methylase
MRNQLAPERQHLGYREVQTLKLLGAEVGFSACPGATLLDLGCADRFLEPACTNEGWNYTGLDYNDVDFEVGKLSVAANSVDIAISLAVIEHLREPENFISEIFRCLKPGGLIYLSTPNFQLDWKNFYNDPTHVRPYTPTSLEELLRLNGFMSPATFPGIRCKGIGWYRGKNRFLKAYYLLPFRNDTRFPVPSFLKGHARSIFSVARKPIA